MTTRRWTRSARARRVVKSSVVLAADDERLAQTDEQELCRRGSILWNNSPKDGKEHVFYYERSRGPLNGPAAQQNYANGGYLVIDFDRCERKGFAEAHDPHEDSQPPRLLQNQSGIIKYKGKHYIFDLSELITIESDLKKPTFRLHLSGYAKFGREAVPRLGPLCVYSTPITQPK